MALLDMLLDIAVRFVYISVTVFDNGHQHASCTCGDMARYVTIIITAGYIYSLTLIRT